MVMWATRERAAEVISGDEDERAAEVAVGRGREQMVKERGLLGMGSIEYMLRRSSQIRRVWPWREVRVDWCLEARVVRAVRAKIRSDSAFCWERVPWAIAVRRATRLA